jgi:hypothetical protein
MKLDAANSAVFDTTLFVTKTQNMPAYMNVETILIQIRFWKSKHCPHIRCIL